MKKRKKKVRKAKQQDIDNNVDKGDEASLATSPTRTQQASSRHSDEHDEDKTEEKRRNYKIPRAYMVTSENPLAITLPLV
ncbi:unnamed protein product [Anisakis simplex]|uniref:Uncharacterized protein n=1 Tax=Anisakis simplex TaxID=6269 RepID=A0A0M3JI96_ANISI|nr:unnamed protein product [Anisakis simplex]